MTPEQQARNILERMGVTDAQTFSSGDVVELANLIAELAALRRVAEAALPIYGGMPHGEWLTPDEEKQQDELGDALRAAGYLE